MKLVIAIVVLLAWIQALPAASELGDRQVLEILGGEAARDRAIRRALSYLRGLQDERGAFGSATPVASSSLALMAHFAAGDTPEDLVVGEALRRGITYVLDRQGGDGYFGNADGSRMYGHGIATLMLAEALGMCGDEELEERIRQALEQAVAVTVAAARRPKSDAARGGWRYQPTDSGSDLSLSGWQLMSLHATAQVGISVPEEVVIAAVDYARRLTTADGQVGYEASGQDHPALRGAALISFAIGGRLDLPETARVADRIVTNPIGWQGPWFYYRCYYDAVGLSRAAPALWDGYAATLEGILIDHQEESGAWPRPPGDNEGNHGVVYRTSMAVLALAVNKHLLPAYQR